MPRVAPAVPAESDLLCESCGYTLNGLPDDARCPECGTPVAESAPGTRSPSAWDRHPLAGIGVGPQSVIPLVRTTGNVIASPTPFFRGLKTRSPVDTAKTFARFHIAAASVLFALAAVFHTAIALPQALYWWESAFGNNRLFFVIASLGLIPASVAVVGLPIWLVTRAAAKLTTIEGTYRGLRLPYPAVLRVLNYHTADYLPVALLALATTGGYWSLTRAGVLGYETLVTYLYVLSAEVVLSAGYLFNTYWRAMRATMYANA